MANVLQNICLQKWPNEHSVVLGEQQVPGINDVTRCAAAAARVADTEGVTGCWAEAFPRSQGCTPEAS